MGQGFGWRFFLLRSMRGNFWWLKIAMHAMQRGFERRCEVLHRLQSNFGACLAPRGTSSYDKMSAFMCRFERGQFLWNKTRCLTGCTGSPSSGRKRLLVDHCSSLANTADGSALRKRAGLLIPRLRIPFLPPKIPTPPTPTPQRATIAALRLTTWREKFQFGDIPKVAFGAIKPAHLGADAR
jgi:hypothetical protein